MLWLKLVLMEVNNQRKATKSFWSRCCKRWDSKKSPEDALDSPNSGAMETKPGWKAIPYILGNETIERTATFGMTANLMVYLVNVFNLGQLSASNIIGIWSGVSNCIPLIGAAIADAYWGKFRTIVWSSFGTLMGMLILTLTAWVPQLHPPSCTVGPCGEQVCVSPTSTQMAILIFGLFWLAIGTGGIKPCTIPFAIDQFDTNSPEGRKGVSSFFSWYYTAQTLVQLISLTIIVYIQNKNWVLGFGTLGVLMSIAIILFFVGKRIYAKIPPEGSIFSSIAQVFVAACKKYRLRNPSHEEKGYYDPPLEDDEELKIPLTKQLRCLNKAALIQDNDIDAQGEVKNSWRLCSIQQVEEVKCLIKILPIWASGFLCFIPNAQQSTFPVSQAMQMNLHIGSYFEIPSASFSVISLITIGIWLPVYELLLQPALAKITKREEGFTSLQKILLGNIFSILTMVSAGLVEGRRRSVALAHGAPISAMWLAPQFVFLGFCEVFTIVGHTEFYNTQSPQKMKSVGNSLTFLLVAFANYAGTLAVNIVQKVSRSLGKTDWMNNDINKGRLDYYYFLVAGLGALNLVYLLFCVKCYRYKVHMKAKVVDTP